MNILLVEPNYTIKYPNLALMKWANFHKKVGDNITYVKGNTLNIPQPDIIYISTMFTYYGKETIDCINFYKNRFTNTLDGSAEIHVGGIFASLMPEYVKKQTGIEPFVGYSKELDRITPYYPLAKEMAKYSEDINKWLDFSVLFSTRGCKNKCGFCAVKILEPEFNIIENWKEHIDLNKKYVMFQDNNLTSCEFSHFKDVMEFIIKNKLITCFNNGFDVRIMTDEHIELLSKVKWYKYGLRIAFDNMSQDGYFQKCVKKLLKKGVPKGAFLVFNLFNFNDTLEEADYRCRECLKLGIRPYPMPYRPWEMLDKTEPYVSKNWTKELITLFRRYWLLGGNYRTKDLKDFLEKNKSITYSLDDSYSFV